MKFDTTSIEKIRQRLSDEKEILGVAESVTAGFLQAALASAEGASEFFEGGITTYNIDQKVHHLGIDRKLGEACNCVSEEVAKQMAMGAVNLFSCTWSIAVTGYATPVEESDFSVFAWYAINKKDRTLKTSKILLKDLKGEDAQLAYVNAILAEFSNLI